MSDNRELLLMAAKGAGLSVLSAQSSNSYLALIDGRVWNPIAHDGDALRLAVTLGIRIAFVAIESQSGYPNACKAGTFECGEITEWFDDHADPFAATRMAIVKAAAAIGRATP